MKQIHRKHTKAVMKSFEYEIVTKFSKARPIDSFLRDYFKKYKSLGSTDRLKVHDAVYSLVRYRDLLNLKKEGDINWDQQISDMQDGKISELQKNTSISPWQRQSVPKILYSTLVQNYGEDKAFTMLNVLNMRAPQTVRANPLKVTRERLLNKWKGALGPFMKKTSYSTLGIQFTTHLPGSLYDLKEFEKGFFEIQDEGSQLAGQNVPAEPGQLVQDYCAGSGGKTLTFGPFMKNTGQIFQHDIRKGTLENAKKRLARAGLTNCQVHLGTSKLEKMEKKFDIVVVDAPCTGVGTLRRNPDIKWKFDKDYLEFNVDRQKQIFSEAIRYLKKDGKIVYMTCSILDAENIDQVKYFINEYKLKLLDGKHFECMPTENGHDGFFSATQHF